MIALSNSRTRPVLRRINRLRRRRAPRMRAISRFTPKAGAIRRIFRVSPSTTTWPASRARRPSVVIGHVAAAPRTSASAPAASCSEPLAARHRRAVRHAGRAFPGPNRSRSRRAPGTDQLTGGRCAARPMRPNISPGRARTAGLPGAGRAGPAIHAVPGAGPRCRCGSSDRAIRRAARGRVRAALRIRLAFRARPWCRRSTSTANGSSLPRSSRVLTPWSASMSSPLTPTEARRLYIAAAVVHQHCARRPGPAAAADRRYRRRFGRQPKRRRRCRTLARSVVGTPDTVRAGPLEALVARDRSRRTHRRLSTSTTTPRGCDPSNSSSAACGATQMADAR